MTRYVTSRYYLQTGLAVCALGVLSVWAGLSWPPAFVAAALFLGSSAVLLFLGLRPSIEIHDTHLTIGRRVIPWLDIRRVDRSFESPLIVHITLFDNSRVALVYPGDIDSVRGLLRQLRRGAREALIDGQPYRKFWGEDTQTAASRSLASPRYRLLRPEDEAEVERLYQRLKTVRHLDPDGPTDEE
ncbi:MAG TPA: hypothetical protein VN428_05315 [Bryobacteraceae bacterium]|nr:hypothetical protein [Bryobacteraceae bacterium]